MNAIAHLFRRSSPTVALWSQEARATMRLAAPLVLIELAWVAMVTTDRIMMGWLGTESLAAGALVGHLFIFLEYFAMGILVAIAPILSQHLGARRFRLVRRTFRQGMWAAVIVAIPCMVMLWYSQAILVLLGQDPDLAAAGQAYVRYMILGFIPGLWFVVLAEFLAAHMRPRATLVITVSGIGINALADYGLMFGHFGLPRLELIGAGIASAAVATLMFLALLTFVLVDRRLRRYRLLGRLWHVDWSHLYEIVRLGVPIAVAHLAEVGMFLAASLLMGLIGTAALAAHAIANQCALIVYMVPYGIGQAATVRVGRAVGAGKPQATSRAGWSALGLGIGFAVLPALAFWFFGGAIVDLFLDTARPESRMTIELAVSFLAIAALFQFADASLVIAQGALRGLKDTRGPMLIALAGYWGLGLTSAALFGVYLNFGGQAIWISLAVGVSVVGALLIQRFRAQSRRLKGKRPLC
jgi:MATE family multidrug resistance protein